MGSKSLVVKMSINRSVIVFTCITGRCYLRGVHAGDPLWVGESLANETNIKYGHVATVSMANLES